MHEVYHMMVFIMIYLHYDDDTITKQTDISDDRLSDKVAQSSRQTKDKVETPLHDEGDDDVQRDDD